MIYMIELEEINVRADWTKLFRSGSIAAFIIAILLIGEIFVYALIPDRSSPVEIFALFNNNPLAGLLFFDLLGMISYILFIPLILSFYLIMKNSNRAIMLIGTVLFFIGVAAFFANNTGYSVLSLSQQYELAKTQEEKVILLAACQSMITLFDVNAFMFSYILVSIAWTMISFVMLQSKIFSRKIAYAGIFAGVSGITAELIENTFDQLVWVAISFYFLAIIFLITWVFLSGRELLQIGISKRKDDT